MSVIVTMRVSADPATFEEQLRVHADGIGRILDVAKRHGLIAHRWYAGDGEVLAADEWPDPAELPGVLRRGAAGRRAGHGGGGRHVASRDQVLAHARHG